MVVRDHHGAAVVERRGDRFRYRPVDHDVLGYDLVNVALARSGAADPEGFVDGDTWLRETADHPFPDAPCRVWDAFGAQVVNPCRVLFTVKDGYYAGMASFARLVDMASTHGGLNQINSDAVLLTTRPDVVGPLRTRDVMGAVEPRWRPRRIGPAER